MMVFQMTAAATVINNMLNTPTCGGFFYRKDVFQKIWYICIKLLLLLLLLLELSWLSIWCEILVSLSASPLTRVHRYTWHSRTSLSATFMKISSVQNMWTRYTIVYVTICTGCYEWWRSRWLKGTGQ